MLLPLEAESALSVPVGGTIAEIAIGPGQTVAAKDLLIMIEA